MKSIKSVSNKKRKDAITTTPVIKSFFENAPKSFVIKDKPKSNHESTSSSREFYIHVLAKKLQERNAAPEDEDIRHENELGVNRIEDFGGKDGASALVEKSAEHVENIVGNEGGGAKLLCQECDKNRKERDEWEEKYKELKKMYYKLAVHHSELDLKHKDLKMVATAKTSENNIGLDVLPTGAACSDIFTPNELKFLQYMDLGKQKDSTFVLQCLKFAYKKELSVLNNKSLFGTKGRIEFTDDGKQVHQPAKKALSPHKVDRIRELFIDRISKSEINSVEYGVRIKPTYLNQLFASAIKNACKTRDTD